MADPQILGDRYQLEAAIGDGAMARVYRARDIRLGRVVAVKLLRDQFSSEPHFVERFMQEARLAAGLAHPNIIGVYDVGSDGDLHYIVMEYVDGDNLRQLIAREAPLQLDAVLPVIRQLGEALDYAHFNGIVHRDIKPENILLTDKGEVKIGDFGIARALAASGRTATGTVLGSVSYFSPEQASGHPATPQSDLYSVGIILFEMLTRQVPFAGATPVATAMAQVNDPPPALRTFRPDLPVAVEGVVLKAIAKNPAVRYHSGQDLTEALLQASQGESMHQGRRTASALAPTMVNPAVNAQALRLRKPARGNGGALAALLTTAALLIAAVLVARGLTSGDQSATTVHATVTATVSGVSGAPSATAVSGVGPSASTATVPAGAPTATVAVGVVAVPSATVGTAPQASPTQGGVAAAPTATENAPQPGATATGVTVVAATATPPSIFATGTAQVAVPQSETPSVSASGGPPPPPSDTPLPPFGTPVAQIPQTPGASPTPGASATPAATAVLGPVSVDLVTAKGISGLTPVNPTSTFAGKTPTIYAVATVHNKPKSKGLHFEWRYPNGKTFAYDNPYVVGYTDTTGYAELYPTGPGDYSVTVSIGGRVLGTETFTVMPGAGGATATP